MSIEDVVTNTGQIVGAYVGWSVFSLVRCSKILFEERMLRHQCALIQKAHYLWMAKKSEKILKQLGNNRDVVICALTYNMKYRHTYILDFLQRISTTFLDDSEIMLAACANYGYSCLKHSLQLQHDPNFLLRVIAKNEYAIDFATKEMWQSHEFIMKAIEISAMQTGYVFVKLPKHLKTDRSFLRMALERSRHVIVQRQT